MSEARDPVQRYWRDPSAENRSALRDLLVGADFTKFQYTHGAEDVELVAPESYTLDQALLDRPGNDEVQLDLMLDYRSNVALYPEFQEYFRAHKPPTLAVWGKNDPFFLPAGAEAFKRDNPGTEVRLHDAGHFALETHAGELSDVIRDFLGRNVEPPAAR